MILSYLLFLFPTILLLVSASDRGFLIVQSDTQNKIVYSLLKTFDESVQKTLQTNSGDGAAEPPSDGEETTSTTTTTTMIAAADANEEAVEAVLLPKPGLSYDLITAAQVRQPRGIATWSSGKEHFLYVHDAHSQSVYRYGLHIDGDSLTIDQNVPTKNILTGVNGIQAIAVDYQQNFFYIVPKPIPEEEVTATTTTDATAATTDSVTTEQYSQLYRIPFTQVLGLNKKNEPPILMYDDLLGVPNSLSTDGLYLYWSNSQSGSQAGSVVMAPSKVVLSGTEPKKLSTSYTSVSGVCPNPDNVYFTSKGTTGLLLGILKKKGKVQPVKTAVLGVSTNATSSFLASSSDLNAQSLQSGVSNTGTDQMSGTVATVAETTTSSGSSGIRALHSEAELAKIMDRLITNSAMSTPSGCVYDVAQGAVYVADEGTNMVYEVPQSTLRFIKNPVPLCQIDGAKRLALLRAGSMTGLSRSIVRTMVDWVEKMFY